MTDEANAPDEAGAAPLPELVTTGRNADGTWAPGNSGRPPVHGGYSKRVLEDARPWMAEVLAQIVADKGGQESLSEMQRQVLAQGVGPTLVILRHLGENIAAEGVLTSKGKRRAATTVYLQTLDRLTRLAQLIGLERMPRKVNDLDAYVQEKYGGD